MSSSIILLSSPSPSSSSLLSSSPLIFNKNGYLVDKIKHRLQYNKANYQVIVNTASALKSKCWNVFGFPAKRTETGDFERIFGYVSCRHCYQTYTYATTTGTRLLNSHSCVANFLAISSSSTSTQTTTQTTLDTFSKNWKQIKLSENETNKFKDLVVKWICKDMRPFTLTEDEGLRDIFQQLICLGMHLDSINLLLILFFNIGVKYGVFNIKSIIRGADTISNHVGSLADEYRSDLTEILKEPYNNEAVCISPDIWHDPYKQLSYLGLSCSFVDTNFQYKVVDLCCRPYYEVDKSGDNLFSVNVLRITLYLE